MADCFLSQRTARVLLASVSLFLLHPAQGAVTISPPTSPVVAQGQTVQFSANASVTWSLAPGSAGTIDPDGTYHAPASVTAKQTLGGCQVYPNNHVFNTRVDTLPVHAKSNTWIAAANGGTINYVPGFPINSVTSALPTTPMTFTYTPLNNGPFRIAPAPDLKIESGLYSPYFGDTDRHNVAIESDTCVFQEIYNYYPAGTNVSQCVSCNSQSGLRFSSLTPNLPVSGATDAAGLPLVPLSLHREELIGGNIRHALRVTVPATAVHASYIWPATAFAGFNTRDTMPFGARIRLKSGYTLSSSNPYTLTLIKQLKEYGLILADIGPWWQIQTADMDLYYDPQIYAAFNEIAAAITPNQLEIVDESSLMISPSSGETLVDAVTVIARNTANPADRDERRVILQGVTIGMPAQVMTFQAGTPAQTLQAWVHGSSNPSIAWSMSPSVGQLSAAGVYTPPASVAQMTSFTIRATAHADPTVFTTLRVTILPTGPIRINSGGPAFTDSQGNAWSPECCTVGKTYSFYTPNWPQQFPDIGLFADVAVGTDLIYAMQVAPGNYRIKAKFTESSYSAPGRRIMHLEAQGQLIYQNVDLYVAAGGQNKPVEFELPAIVGSNGKLMFALRRVLGEQTTLSALEILPDAGIPAVTITPNRAVTVHPAQTQPFSAAVWFLPDTRVNWSIHPPLGSISATGLYTAPANPVSASTPVDVTATSVGDPAKSATVRITLDPAILPIRINAGGSEFVDGNGNHWAGDYGYSGQSVFYSETNTIAGAAAGQQPLYQSSRYSYDDQSFYYDLPVANGTFTVTLKWAEYRNSNQQYRLDVRLNGQTVLSDFDPVAAAGGLQRAVDRSFNTTVSNGRLRIDFVSRVPAYASHLGAVINGIEILSTGGGPGNNPPTTAITSPANNAVYTAPATVSMAATASDTDGTISRVEFYNGATLIGTDTTSPYTLGWTPVAAGNYSLTAKAYDNTGAQTPSALVPIVVNAPTVNSPPVVSMILPVNNTTLTTPATVDLAASASDADGTLTRVEFYNGSTLLGSDTTSPYTFRWNSIGAGNYTLTARAFDNSGDSTLSAAINLVIQPGTVSRSPRDPDLSSLRGKKFRLRDQIMLSYPDAFTRFNWTVSPLSDQSAGQLLTQSPAIVSGNALSIATPSPLLQLSPMNLQAGIYQISVQAQNGAQLSNSVSAIVSLVDSDQNGVLVYPNPWRSDRHQGKDVILANLTDNAIAKIFSISGHLIRELRASGNTVVWDGRDNSGDIAASGVYIYLVTDPLGNKFRGKIAIVR